MQSAVSERRLAAILIADVSGYSRLMNIDEDGTHQRMKAHLQQVIKPEIAARRGHIVKSTGDGFLAEFQSIVEAMQSALTIQTAFAEQNSSTPTSERLYWRIGINIGDVIVEKEDIYGNDVNIAARLEGLAEPGGICVSEAVYTELKNKIDLKFESIGKRKLKNISEPVHAYRLNFRRRRSGSASTDAESYTHEEFLDIPSVAVLPFANLTPNGTNEYMADGITEDLITNLSMSPEFFVIARTSSFAFKDGPLDLESVARQLGVRYLVIGSVQQDDTGFRITAQLIEAKTGIQLWARRYDPINAELLEVRDEITHSIAATLMTTAGPIAKAELRRQATKSPDIFDDYDRYLRARQYFHRSILPPWSKGKEWSDRSKAEFSRAIELSDPPLWLNYAGLGWQHAIDFEFGYGENEEMSSELAFENAAIAVKNAPDSHMAHWIMGWAYLFTKKDHERAMYHYRRARELNVGDSRLMAEMAQLLIFSGEPEQAIVQLKQAIRLNPLREQWYDEFLGWAYEENDQPELAIETLVELGELEGLWSHAALAGAYVLTGQIDRFAEQHEVLNAMVREQLETDFTSAFWRQWVQTKCPYKDKARAERIIELIDEGLNRARGHD